MMEIIEDIKAALHDELDFAKKLLPNEIRF